MKSLRRKTNEKQAFIYTMIAGLLIHMYALTNNFLTYDSMWNLYSTQDMISSGRPFLQYACIPSSYYDLTWINGLLALFYLAIAAAILVDIFDLKSKMSILLLSISLVAFPSMASLFCYSFTMDGYALAILLAILSVWLCINYKFGFLLGAITLGISMGIYQAYLSLTILLCIFVLIFDLECKTWKEILKKVIKMLIMGVFAFVFYLVSLRILLFIKNVTLSGYQGTSEVFNLSIHNLLYGVKNAYVNFIDFARYGGILTPNIYAKISLILIVVLCGIIFTRFIVNVWKKQGLIRVIFILVLIFLIPLATSTIAIISSNTFFHILLRYPWVLFFAFAIALVDRFNLKENVKKEKKSYALNYAVFILIFTLMFNYAVTANVVYYNMNERYERTYATSLRILMKLEEVEGYSNETEVAILGGVLYAGNFVVEETTYELTKDYFGSTGVLSVSDTEKFAEFMKHYHGKEIRTIGISREIELTETDEFSNMGRFPEKDSIGWIEGVLVVKLNG